MERKQKMKKTSTLVLMAAIVLVLSGCSGVRFVGFEPSPVNIPKTFYERTITYRVDANAKQTMTNLENLLGQVKGLQPPYPDDLVLPIYRDTDIDRDRRITAPEATAYYNDCILRFEDSLGPVHYHTLKSSTLVKSK